MAVGRNLIAVINGDDCSCLRDVAVLLSSDERGYGIHQDSATERSSVSQLQFAQTHHLLSRENKIALPLARRDVRQGRAISIPCPV
jgi:hypothetical protein